MNLPQTSLNELFTAGEERIQQISIAELKPFANHPFKVLRDEEMDKLCESIREYGILSPLMARPLPEGSYEIISGHQRKVAAELLGVDKLPGKLHHHLQEIEENAQNQMELLIRQMADAQGVTEQLKSANQMEWVRRMNNIRDAAEEIVQAEIIYA